MIDGVRPKITATTIALSAPSLNDGAGFHQPQPMRRFSADVLPLRPMNKLVADAAPSARPE